MELCGLLVKGLQFFLINMEA